MWRSEARSAFFRPKARAISRTPALPLCVPMKATTSSRDGRPGGRFFLAGFFKTTLREGSTGALASPASFGGRHGRLWLCSFLLCLGRLFRLGWLCDAGILARPFSARRGLRTGLFGARLDQA